MQWRSKEFRLQKLWISWWLAWPCWVHQRLDKCKQCSHNMISENKKIAIIGTQAFVMLVVLLFYLESMPDCPQAGLCPKHFRACMLLCTVFVTGLRSDRVLLRHWPCWTVHQNGNAYHGPTRYFIWRRWSSPPSPKRF